MEKTFGYDYRFEMGTEIYDTGKWLWHTSQWGYDGEIGESRGNWCKGAIGMLAERHEYCGSSDSVPAVVWESTQVLMQDDVVRLSP